MTKKIRLYEDVGEMLKHLRGNEPQRQTAETLGITLRAYQYIESGERLPRLSVVIKIAEKYKVSPYWIFSGRASMSPSEETLRFTDVAKMVRELDRSLEREMRKASEREREFLDWAQLFQNSYRLKSYTKMPNGERVNMIHSFADRFRFLREKINLNQSQMARFLNMSPGYISKIEKGFVPSDKFIVHICSEFGLRFKWMKEGEGAMYGRMHSASQPWMETGFSSPGKLRLIDRIKKRLFENPDDPPNDPPDFEDMLYWFITTIENGDKGKIEAVRTILCATAEKGRPPSPH